MPLAGGMSWDQSSVDTGEGLCTHPGTLIEANPTSRNPCKMSGVMAFVGQIRKMPPLEVAFYGFVSVNTAMKCHSILFDSTGSGVLRLISQLYASGHLGIKHHLLSLCSLVSHW